MSHKNIYEVNDNQLIINLPKEFKNKMKVLVTIDDITDSYAGKLLLLKQAATDPLFLADVEEVRNDFDPIDNEALWFSKNGLFAKQIWAQLLVLSKVSQGQYW